MSPLPWVDEDAAGWEEKRAGEMRRVSGTFRSSATSRSGKDTAGIGATLQPLN